MIFSILFSCTSRTMIGSATSSLTDIQNTTPNIQVSTQHYFILPIGPTFKGRWSESHKLISTGIGVGLISLIPQKSRWFMNPPTVGFSTIEWHNINGEIKWGTFSPFVQITAPPLCISPKGCFLSISPFVEYEYSNILDAPNQHTWSAGLYWSTTN